MSRARTQLVCFMVDENSTSNFYTFADAVERSNQPAGNAQSEMCQTGEDIDDKTVFYGSLSEVLFTLQDASLVARNRVVYSLSLFSPSSVLHYSGTLVSSSPFFIFSGAL